ncbi:MAG: hypothetical protein IJC04_07880 [Oscillospiraceae bacterium]|nr:hypothetical protein [Oscillospiraceae bacterium]
MGDNLFVEFDNEIKSREKAIKYAEEHAYELIAARENCGKVVYSTYGYSLGVACPDLINHRVIGGHKRGRVIKSIEGVDDYSIIGYDSKGKLVHYTNVNSFGTEEAYFVFELENYIWAVTLFTDKSKDYFGKFAYLNVIKFRFDERGRILLYASIGKGSLDMNRYEYPDNENEPIICRKYHYVPGLYQSSKDIPAGYEHSPMSIDLYEISPDMKVIRDYYKSGEEFVFRREICSKGKKSAKPKIAEDSYERLAEWLDKELEKDIPTDGGVYFDIFSETEDGFGLSLCITEDFTPDDDDWGCYVKYSSDMHMVSTNGEMEWEDVLKNVVRLLKKYLRSGEKRALLKKYKGVGTAYSDSDIEYIYVKK